jgi:hypothetical protein
MPDTNREFQFRPYDGFGAIHFGMTFTAVGELLAPPDWIDSNSRGERNEGRKSGISIRYDVQNGGAVEAGFVPRTRDRIIYDGVDLCSAPDVVRFLLERDPEPFEYFGFLVFAAIGLTATGFHDDDESQRAITVFKRGRWDWALATAERWRPV